MNKLLISSGFATVFSLLLVGRVLMIRSLSPVANLLPNNESVVEISEDQILKALEFEKGVKLTVLSDNPRRYLSERGIIYDESGNILEIIAEKTEEPENVGGLAGNVIKNMFSSLVKPSVVSEKVALSKPQITEQPKAESVNPLPSPTHSPIPSIASPEVVAPSGQPTPAQVAPAVVVQPVQKKMATKPKAVAQKVVVSEQKVEVKKDQPKSQPEQKVEKVEQKEQKQEERKEQKEEKKEEKKAEKEEKKSKD